MRNLTLLVLAAMLGHTAPSKAATIVDIVIVVDESGSMAGEHAWLAGMINTLNTSLTNLGFTVRFGLFGFGDGSFTGDLGRTLLNGGSASDFAAAASGLQITGGFEDGYSGLQFARNNYSFAPGSRVNYILVTDEDRDNGNNSLTFQSMLSLLSGQNALLNVVVSNSFFCPQGTALGVKSDLTGYQANGSGGFTSCAGGTVGSGDGTTTADYVDLALASGGAAWDLDQLRFGGLTATSFTAAFIDIKVQEIASQPGSEVPEPATFASVAFSIAAIAVWRKRRHRTS